MLVFVGHYYDTHPEVVVLLTGISIVGLVAAAPLSKKLESGGSPAHGTH